MSLTLPYQPDKPTAAAVRAALRCGRASCPCRLPLAKLHCPAHAGNRPALTLAAFPDGITLDCHAGCDAHAILRALDRRGIWPLPGGLEPEVPQDLTVRRIAAHVPRPVVWLWPGYLVLGKLSLILGAPGLGKSWVALDIAARVSTGAATPDGRARVAQGPVAVLTSPDVRPEGLASRLDAQRADCSQVYVLDSLVGPLGEPVQVRLPRDAARVGELVASIGARLLVVDPIESLAGPPLRGSHEALAVIARDTNAAVLAVGHLPDPGIDAALTRARTLSLPAASVLIVAALPRSARDRPLEGRARNRRPDPSAGSGRRALVPVKNILGPLRPALPYAILGRSGLQWSKPLPIGEFMAELGGRRRTGPAVETALRLLEELLADGPRPAADVFQTAAESGIARTTLYDAKRLGRIESVRTTGSGAFADGHWSWRLP